MGRATTEDFLMNWRNTSESVEMSEASSLRPLVFRSFERLCPMGVCHLAYT